MGNQQYKERRSFLIIAFNLFLAGCSRILRPSAPANVPPTALPTAIPTLSSISVTEPVSVVEAEQSEVTSERVTISTELADDAYWLPLVTRHVTETTAALFFALENDTGGVLLVETIEGGQQIIVQLDEADERHLITIEGLQPGVRYRAQVGLGSPEPGYKQPPLYGEAWGPVEFTTQSSDRPIRFVMTADTGFGDERSKQIAELMAQTGADFCVHGGDCVYWADQNVDAHDAWIQKWYQPFAPVLRSMPIYSVNGNHDYDPPTYYNGQPFYFIASPPVTDPNFEPSARDGLNQFYAVAYGSTQFIFLDSQVLFGQPGREEQQAWLEERLADDRWKTTIPVFHVEAYSSGKHGDSDSWVPRRTWAPLFNDNPRVRLVLNGHDHNYERLIVGDTTYIVSAGGSSTLYGKDIELPESQVFVSRTHHTLFEMYDDRIEMQAIALEGDVIDRATIAL